MDFWRYRFQVDKSDIQTRQNIASRGKPYACTIRINVAVTEWIVMFADPTTTTTTKRIIKRNDKNPSYLLDTGCILTIENSGLLVGNRHPIFCLTMPTLSDKELHMFLRCAVATELILWHCHFESLRWTSIHFRFLVPAPQNHRFIRSSGGC